MVRLCTTDTLLNTFTQISRTSSFPSSVVLMITVRESYMCMTVIHQYESAAKMFYQMVFVRYSAHKVTFSLKQVKKNRHDRMSLIWALEDLSFFYEVSKLSRKWNKQFLSTLRIFSLVFSKTAFTCACWVGSELNTGQKPLAEIFHSYFCSVKANTDSWQAVMTACTHKSSSITVQLTLHINHGQVLQSQCDFKC